MVNSNANAIGIIFPNSYDNLVPELAGDRLMASIPEAGFLLPGAVFLWILYHQDS